MKQRIQGLLQKQKNLQQPLSYVHAANTCYNKSELSYPSSSGIESSVFSGRVVQQPRLTSVLFSVPLIRKPAGIFHQDDFRGGRKRDQQMQ